MPPRLGKFWAFVDAKGNTHLAAGTMRMDVSGATEFADDAFATQLAASAPVADGGWVFVAEDGTVARSTSFIGPLRRLGEIPRAVHANGPQNGRVAVVDELGRAWTTDGTRPIERLRTPEGTVMDVGFADVNRGAVVMEGGALWLTDDGGLTWDPIEQPNFAAVSLEARFDNAHPADYILIAATTDGGHEVFRTDVPGPEAQVGKLDTDAVMLRVWAGSRQQARLRTGDRDAYTMAKDGSVERRNYETGQVLARAKLDGSQCHLIPWGPRLLASCDQPGVKAWSAAEGLTFEPLALGNGEDPQNVRWSDDGIHAVARGACTGQDLPRGPKEMLVCARRADGWHTLRVPRDDLHPVHGKHALLNHSLLDLESGVTTPLVHGDQTSGVQTEVQWVPDGSLVTIETNVQEHRSYMVIGPPAGPFRIHRLPIDAEGVSFVDAMRGVIAGKDLAEVWRTLDGGETWEHVNPPVDGDPRRIALELNGAAWRRLEGVQCRETGCWLEKRLVLDGWGPLVPGATVMLAERPPARAHRDVFGSILLTRGATDCVASAPLPPVPDRVAAGRRERTLYGPQGPATLRMATGGALELEWRVDRKPLRSTGTIAEASGDDTSQNAASYLLRAITKAGALIERCDGTTLENCSLLWARAGGAITSVESLEKSLLARGGLFWVTTALPRSDGGVVAVLTRPGTAATQDVVASIAPDGTARLRWFAWSAPAGDVAGNGMRRVLGRYRGELGYVFADPFDPKWLRFISVEKSLHAAPMNLPWVAENRDWNAAKCSQIPRTEDELEIYEPTNLSGPDYAAVEPAYALIHARVTSAGICVLDAHSWAYAFPFRDLAIPAGELQASGNGSLKGTLRNPGGSRTVECKN